MNSESDGFLSYIREHHRELVPGTYACKITPGSVRPFSTDYTTGVGFLLSVLDGPYKGREFPVRMCQRNDKFALVVARDMNALASWAEALGVTGGKDLLGLVFYVGKATDEAGGVLLKLDVRKTRQGLSEVAIAAFSGTRKANADDI